MIPRCRSCRLQQVTVESRPDDVVIARCLDWEQVVCVCEAYGPIGCCKVTFFSDTSNQKAPKLSEITSIWSNWCVPLITQFSMNYRWLHLSLFGIFCSKLTLLTFVATRPFESELSWRSLLQKLTLLTFVATRPFESNFHGARCSKSSGDIARYAPATLIPNLLENSLSPIQR